MLFGEAVPAQLAELAVGVLESLRRRHAAVVAKRAPSRSPDAVQRVEHFGCEVVGFLEDRGDGVGRRILEARQLRDLARPASSVMTNSISASGARYWLIVSSDCGERGVTRCAALSSAGSRGSPSCRACRRWSSESRRRNARDRAPRTSRSRRARRNRATCLRIASSVGGSPAPACTTTNATGRSPHFSSGTPTTAASATPGHAQHEVLDVERRHPLAARLHDVLDAVDDLQVALRVDHADVAGVQPAAVPQVLGPLGLAEVALREPRRAHDDLALASRRRAPRRSCCASTMRSWTNGIGRPAVQRYGSSRSASQSSMCGRRCASVRIGQVSDMP